MKTTTNFRTGRMVQLALFTAIIVLMAFSPLGYINTMGLSITTVGIPVIIGAIVLGPMSGAILGGVFGISSFIRCFGLEPFGSALLAINPIATFIVCMVPRVLIGLLAGLIFQGLRKIDKKKNFAYALTGLAGSLINTVLFLTLIIVFFYNSDYIQAYAASIKVNNVFAFFFAVASVNGTVEAIVCMITVAAVAKALEVYSRR